MIRKKHFYHFAAIVLTMALFSSCITSKNTNYLQNPSGPIPHYDANFGYEEYVLAPYDKVYVRIYSPDKNMNTLINGNSQSMNMNSGSSDFSDLYTYTIDKSGKITLPIVGDVTIGGQFIREAKTTVKKALGTAMVDECSVDIRIMGRYFSVIGGNVNGKYPIIREKMNIFQALAMAGDLTTMSDRKQLKILRETPNGHEIKTFDIRSKDIINSEFYYIQPNDVIYVPDVNTQIFSVTSLGSVFSTFFSTVSFGMLIYHLATPEKPANDQPQTP